MTSESAPTPSTRLPTSTPKCNIAEGKCDSVTSSTRVFAHQQHYWYLEKKEESCRDSKLLLMLAHLMRRTGFQPQLWRISCEEDWLPAGARKDLLVLHTPHIHTRHHATFRIWRSQMGWLEAGPRLLVCDARKEARKATNTKIMLRFACVETPSTNERKVVSKKKKVGK